MKSVIHLEALIQRNGVLVKRKSEKAIHTHKKKKGCETKDINSGTTSSW